jgi:hypothetical protein
MAELLKLKMNVPEVIALQFAIGKNVESTIPNAPYQVMFTLCDGRRTFQPLSFADRIREAGIQASQPFEVTRVSANNFRVRTFEEGTVVSATPPAIAQQASPAQSATPRNGNGAPAPPPPPARPAAPPPPPADFAPRSKAAMAAYKDAVDTFVKMKAYAQTKGLALDVRCEDVRCLAATFMIAGGK